MTLVNAKLCKRVTKRGNPCRNKALIGSDYCLSHSLSGKKGWVYYLGLIGSIASIVSLVVFFLPSRTSDTLPLHVRSFASYARTPIIDPMFTCNGQLCTIGFSPFFKLINTSSNDMVVEDLFFHIQNSNGTELKSSPRPRILTAPNLEVFIQVELYKDGMPELPDSLPNSPSLKEKIKVLDYPIHIPSHSEVFIRADFHLKCLKEGDVITFGTEPEKTEELIPTCFGMKSDEKYVRAIEHRLVVTSNQQLFSYSFSEPIMIAGKIIRFTKVWQEGAKPTRESLKKIEDMAIEQNR